MQAQERLVAQKFLGGQNPAAMPDSNELVALRVTRLREALGFDGQGGQTAFAKFLGVTVNRWGNVERGLPLSNDLAFKIVEKVPGMTLDYLYYGKRDGLPYKLIRDLEEGNARIAESG